MIKWLIVLLLAIPRIIYSQIACLIMNANKEKYSLERRYKVVRDTIVWINKLLRRQYHLSNFEVVKQNNGKGRLFVPNHLSMFDVMVCIELFEKPITIISKKENSGVPFLTAHLRAIDTLLIDRSNIRQSLTICKQAAKLMEEGRDVLIFAEGTRSKDGNVGQLKAALPILESYAKTDVYAICFYNTKKALSFPIITYPKVHIYTTFLQPLDYSFYLENRKTYNEVIRKMLQDQLDTYKKEVAI